MNTVTAFWSPITHESLFGEVPLIELWREVWASHGWTPRVVSLLDAVKHPRFEALHHKAMSLPTTNLRQYEYLCFIRWLAFAMAGGGLMCDYDVLPVRSFPPRDWAGFVNLVRHGIVGLVYGSSEDCERVIDAFLAYEPLPFDLERGVPHVSDMTVLYNNRYRLFDAFLPVCHLYGDEDWESYPVIHFNSDRCHPGVARVDLIRKVICDNSLFPAK